MERDPELVMDQLGHAAGRPEVSGEAVRGWFLGQPLADLLILFESQEPGSAGRPVPDRRRPGAGPSTWRR